MPRRPRIHLAGGLYHAILRGNHRQPIFYQNADRTRLDEIVAHAAAADGVRIHAYCWMPNHIHLAVQVGERPLGHFMQRVASQYARRVQHRLLTTGNLFERRHRAILVQDTSYLVSLVRYIHRNPVRAGLVGDPIDYDWSSHRAYLGLAKVPWLTVEPTLALFADHPMAAREAYGRYIEIDSPENELIIFRQGNTTDPRLVGDAEFLPNITTLDGSRPTLSSVTDLVVQCAAEFGVDLATLQSSSRRREHARVRALIAERLIQSHTATLSEVARLFNRDPSTLYWLLKRHRDKSLSQ